MIETVGDIPAKERYLWIDPQSVEVVIFTNTKSDAARILGWTYYKVLEWRKANFWQEENKTAKFTSKRKEVQSYLESISHPKKYKQHQSTRTCKKQTLP